MKLNFGISYKHIVYYHYVTTYVSYMHSSLTVFKAEPLQLLLSSVSLILYFQASYCHGLSEIHRVKSIMKRIRKRTQKVRRSYRIEEATRIIIEFGNFDPFTFLSCCALPSFLSIPFKDQLVDWEMKVEKRGNN